MTRSLILILALAAAGCSTTGMLENRVVCTMAKDKAYVVSEYGPIGISSKIAKDDTTMICAGQGK